MTAAMPLMDSAPDALLLIAPGCPHCATVLQGLGELVKQSRIGKLTIINMVAHPEVAAEHGVRAAPWMRLGPFTLTGAYTAAELGRWADWASRESGAVHYVEHLLHNGGYRQATAFVAADPSRLKPLLAIVANPAANIEVRLGVSALLEAHAGGAALRALLPELAALSRHADHRVRADACHLLGLTGLPAAREHVERCMGDADAEVRDIAGEALARLEAPSPAIHLNNRRENSRKRWQT